MTKSKKDSRQRVRFAIRKKVSGTSERPRLAIFRSNKEIYAQIIDDINSNIIAYSLLYTKRYNMPFMKGTSGNPICRLKGSVSTNQYPLVNNYKAST